MRPDLEVPWIYGPTLPCNRLVKELAVKSCGECCFSTGGHLFAAANSTAISIFNAYTCENVGNLRRAVATDPPC